MNFLTVYGPLFLLLIVSVFGLYNFNWSSQKQVGWNKHLNKTVYGDSFWGTPTAAIDWCEENYIHSSYIAEYYNTLSSFSLFFSGVVGAYGAIKYKLEKRFVLCYVLVQVIGLGSILFHASMRYEYQLADELPMFWSMMVYGYILYHIDSVRPPSKKIGLLITVYTVLATFAFVYVTENFPAAHQVHILIGVFYCLKKQSRIVAFLESKGEKAMLTIFRIYVASGIFGFGCWILDQACCSFLSQLPFNIPNPQLHAWWHVMMAINCYTGLVPVLFYRGIILKKMPSAVNILPVKQPFVTFVSYNNHQQKKLK